MAQVVVLDGGHTDALSGLEEFLLSVEQRAWGVLVFGAGWCVLCFFCRSTCLLSLFLLLLSLLLALLHLLKATVPSLIEEVSKLDSISRARLKLLSSLSLHQAKAHMVNARLGRVMPPSLLGGLENHIEMVLLPDVSDIDKAVGLESVQAVVDSGHVGGVVIVPAVFLLHHQRNLELPSKEDALSAVVDFDHALLLQLLYHVGNHRVVETLAELLYVDVKATVDLVELDARYVADCLPRLQTLGVAALKSNHLELRTLLELRVLVEALLCLTVEHR